LHLLERMPIFAGKTLNYESIYYYW
jgi:hypothetical protein